MPTNLKDAKKPITIHVTKSHCLKGRRGEKNHCVIAIAASEQTRDFVTDVRIGTRYTTFKYNTGERIRCSTPYQLGKKLKDFDEGGLRPPPGDYTFFPPRLSETIEYQRKMNKKYCADGYKPKRKNRPCKRKAPSRKVINSRLTPN